MSEKRWTYGEITAASEEQIARFMDAAKRYGLAQDTANQSHNASLAFGAYLLWRQLTNGCQVQEDAERLAKLVDAKVAPAR